MQAELDDLKHTTSGEGLTCSQDPGSVPAEIPDEDLPSDDEQEPVTGLPPYELPSLLTYDAFQEGPLSPADIDWKGLQERLAEAAVQLDPTPGVRYRGAYGAGLAAKVMGLHVATRHPSWQDIMAAVLQVSQAQQSANPKGAGVPCCGEQLFSYLHVLRCSLAAMKTFPAADEQQKRLDDLEIRARSYAQLFTSLLRATNPSSLPAAFSEVASLHIRLSDDLKLQVRQKLPVQNVLIHSDCHVWVMRLKMHCRSTCSTWPRR